MALHLPVRRVRAQQVGSAKLDHVNRTNMQQPQVTTRWQEQKQKKNVLLANTTHITTRLSA
jgi:hypothetical protein